MYCISRPVSASCGCFCRSEIPSICVLPPACFFFFCSTVLTGPLFSEFNYSDRYFFLQKCFTLFVFTTLLFLFCLGHTSKALLYSAIQEKRDDCIPPFLKCFYLLFCSWAFFRCFRSCLFHARHMHMYSRLWSFRQPPPPRTQTYRMASAFARERYDYFYPNLLLCISLQFNQIHLNSIQSYFSLLHFWWSPIFRPVALSLSYQYFPIPHSPLF